MYVQVELVNQEISAYNLLIADKQDEVDAAKAALEELTLKNRERIRAMEEEGSLSYWAVLFEANSFSDLLDRLNMVEEIASSDRRRLEEMTAAAEAVADRLRDMMRDQDYIHKDPQSVAASYLSVLGIHSEYGGGKHLRVGIPLFAQDPGQKLSMELYPTIGQLCGASGGAVEHAIREVIQKAWDQHEDGWTEYFPSRRRCPSNKVFISTLAEKLWQD